MGVYPLQYVQSLERLVCHARHGANQDNFSMFVSQTKDVPSRHFADAQIVNEISNTQCVPEDMGMDLTNHLNTSYNMMYDSETLQPGANVFDDQHVVAPNDISAYPVAHSDTTMPVHSLGPGIAPTFAEVSINEGASFFQVYFESIHPRYPFLDVGECNQGYEEWKTGRLLTSSSSPWRLYLVKMVCEIFPSSLLI